MRILVTGAAGFIGSNFVHYWLGQHPDDSVVALDLLTYAGNRANLEGADVPFVQADIADLDIVENVLREHEIEVVVNFAAESHNSLAVVDPSLFARTNVLGTQLLLEAARKVEVERFHHISTCEVYGDLALDSDAAFTEDSPYQPRTPYNASKAAADHYVRAYRETYGLATTITNCSNNYGPYQFPEKVIPLFVTNLLEGQRVPLYGDGLNVRDWCFVEDNCAGVDTVLRKGEIGEIYNIGAGNEITNRELVTRLLDLLGLGEDRIDNVEDRLGHDRRYSISIAKAEALGWSPDRQLDEALAATVEWYQANRAWWEPLKQA